MAAANPNITADAIEATEFMDLSRKYRVTGVPKTIVNETIEIMGGLPEQDFVRAVLELPETNGSGTVTRHSAQFLLLRNVARPNSRQVPSLPFTRSMTSIVPSST